MTQETTEAGKCRQETFCARCRPQKRQQHVDRFVVWRVEPDRALQRRDHRCRSGDRVEVSVWNSHAVPDGGRPETLAAKEGRQRNALTPAHLFPERGRHSGQRGPFSLRRYAEHDVLLAQELAYLHESLHVVAASGAGEGPRLCSATLKSKVQTWRSRTQSQDLDRVRVRGPL
jgi:hypothetical protein